MFFKQRFNLRQRREICSKLMQKHQGQNLTLVVIQKHPSSKLTLNNPQKTQARFLIPPTGLDQSLDHFRQLITPKLVKAPEKFEYFIGPSLEKIDGSIFNEPVEKLRKSFAEEDGIVYLKYSEPGIRDSYRLRTVEMVGIGVLVVVFAVVWHLLFSSVNNKRRGWV